MSALSFLPLVVEIRRYRKKKANKKEQQRQKDILTAALTVESASYQGSYLSGNNVVLLESGQLYMNQSFNGQHIYSGNVMLYVFPDSMLLCHEGPCGGEDNLPTFTFRERADLRLLTVTDSAEIHGKDSFLVSGPDRQYIFICSGKKEKKEWLKAFSSRNQPLPSTSYT